MSNDITDPNKSVIDVANLRKLFDQKIAVEDISVRVYQGEIFGFLGPNGSGKTTTIRMICGLLTADEGSGHCLGYDIIKETDLIKQNVGYMTQKFSLYEDLSIRENLEFIARMYSVKNAQQAVEESLAFLGLNEQYSDNLAGTLSGGWKQRLALSAATLHKPKLLLLDEPTTGIDPKARRKFWDEIHRLSILGVTTLVSTQYMDEAQMCHRLAYINKGKIFIEGTVDEIIDRSKLFTSAIKGPELDKLSKQLQSNPIFRQVTNYGKELHVSGTNQQALNQALEKITAQNYLVTSIRPTLEDVFIHFTESERVEEGVNNE